MTNFPVYQLQGTAAVKDYTGCGDAVLIVQSGQPVTLIYLPENGDMQGIRMKFREGADRVTEVWRGMASCLEFVCEECLYSPPAD